MTYTAKVRAASLLLPLLLIAAFVSYAAHTSHAIFAASPQTAGFTVSTDKMQYRLGETISVLLGNASASPISIPNNCPYQPLSVYKQDGNSWSNLHAAADPAKCAGEPHAYTIPAGKTVKVSYRYWPSLFASPGTYRIIAVPAGQADGPYAEFSVSN